MILCELRPESRSDFIVLLFGQLSSFAVHFASQSYGKLKLHGIIEVFAHEYLGIDLLELDVFVTSDFELLRHNPGVGHGKWSGATSLRIFAGSGDIEHAAAIIHPRMGKPMREAIGGGQAIIPSNVKIGAAGTSINVPLSHKDDVWSFDQIDTMTISIPGAPRSSEIVVVAVIADGGRPRPRVSKAGAVLPPSG